MKHSQTSRPAVSGVWPQHMSSIAHHRTLKYFLVDTGAQVSVLPPTRSDRNFTLSAVNGTPIATYGINSQPRFLLLCRFPPPFRSTSSRKISGSFTGFSPMPFPLHSHPSPTPVYSSPNFPNSLESTTITIIHNITHTTGPPVFSRTRRLSPEKLPVRNSNTCWSWALFDPRTAPGPPRCTWYQRKLTDHTAASITLPHRIAPHLQDFSARSSSISLVKPCRSCWYSKNCPVRTFRIRSYAIWIQHSDSWYYVDLTFATWCC